MARAKGTMSRFRDRDILWLGLRALCLGLGIGIFYG